MDEGWTKVGDKWYYFFEEMGFMAKDTWIGNYYVDSHGVWTKTRWWYIRVLNFKEKGTEEATIQLTQALNGKLPIYFEFLSDKYGEIVRFVEFDFDRA